MTAHVPRDTVLGDDERLQLRELVERHTLTRAAKSLRLARHTLSSAIAGLPLRPGTVLLVRSALAPEPERPERA